MTPSRARLRSAALNLALALGTIAIVLLLAEGVLRVIARTARGGGKEQLERNRYTEHDPVLGWRKTPGADVVYERREYQVRYRVNSRGLRGPERGYDKAGTPRVLALGDSFVEAFMADDAATVTSRLESHLRARGCEAEVINGGTVGYSTDQEYLFHRDEGRKYAPDVTVLFVYHNDIPYLTLDRYQAYPKPRLAFGDGGPPKVANEPVAPYVPAPAAPARPPEQGPPSHLLEFVKQRLERGSARTYNRLAGFGLWEPLRKLPVNEELQLYRVPEMGHLRPSWSAFTWTVQTLAADVSAAGGRLAIAYIPSRMEVSPRVWEFTQERYAIDGSYQKEAVAARVSWIAGRLGVPFVDLTPALAGADSMVAPTYYQTDSHWNPRGMDVAARALSDFLASDGLVPGCR